MRATVSEHPRDNVIYYYTMVNALALFPWVGLVPWIVYKRYKERNFKLAERERFYCYGGSSILLFPMHGNEVYYLYLSFAFSGGAYLCSYC
ncbi:MAG: hypothetical protein ACLT4X_02560 [Phascolarctobacterium sp.]